MFIGRGWADVGDDGTRGRHFGEPDVVRTSSKDYPDVSTTRLIKS